jgi:hypothetical protein
MSVTQYKNRRPAFITNMGDAIDYLVCQLELSNVPFLYTSLYPSYGIIFNTTPHLQHGELFRKSFPDLLRHPRGHHSTGWSTLPRLGRLYFVPSDASIP